MDKNRYRIVVFILIFYEIFCAVHIPSHDIAERHRRDVQITKEAAEQIYSAQIQELSEVKEICNVRCYIRESTILFEIAKFAYEITKVHVYIWQLPRGNIGGIMLKTNLCSVLFPTSRAYTVVKTTDRRYALWIIRKKLLRWLKNVQIIIG